MVATKSTIVPDITATYQAICQFLKTNKALVVNVGNHIAAKHQVHSLQAFHCSDNVTETEKLTTYGEIVKAIVSRDMTKLKGQVANGQAGPPPAPTVIEVDEDRIPTVMMPDAPAEVPSAAVKPRIHQPDAPTQWEKEQTPEQLKAAQRVLNPRTDEEINTEDQLRAILRKIVGNPDAKLDEAKVRTLVAEMMTEREDAITSNVSKLIDEAVKSLPPPVPATLRHEFHVGKAINAIEGTAHRQLPQIVAWLAADVPVWLWGQAGGGKTHLGRQAAAALGIPYYAAPIDETITVGKLVGFRNVANGEFVPGLLYAPFKSGGVILLDECDTNATAIASTNSLIANSHYTFPNGEDVPRHKDFRVLVGANTCGTGAVAGYSARVRMDAATLNRFAVLKLDYDQGMEMELACGEVSTSKLWTSHLAHGDGSMEALCKAYVEWVQKVRAKVGQSVLISPRASYLGVRALRVGIPPAEVADALVFALVTADTRSRILNEAGAVPGAK